MYRDASLALLPRAHQGLVEAIYGYWIRN